MEREADGPWWALGPDRGLSANLSGAKYCCLGASVPPESTMEASQLNHRVQAATEALSSPLPSTTIKKYFYITYMSFNVLELIAQAFGF